MPPLHLTPRPKVHEMSSAYLRRSGKGLPRLCLALVLTVMLAAFGQAHFAFIGRPGFDLNAPGPRCAKSEALVSRKGSDRSSGGMSGGQLILKRHQPPRFEGGTKTPVQELQPVKVETNRQKKRFFEDANSGEVVSEVFVRVEGKMPWKRVGEITNVNGDFVEAVRCQWPLLSERSYHLYKKVKVMLPTSNPIQFGYVDENAEIQMVAEGPLPLGVAQEEYKAMLSRSGFLTAEKPKQWTPHNTLYKEFLTSKKMHHIKKPVMLKREYNKLLDAHRWFDINKYGGNYIDKFKDNGKRRAGLWPGYAWSTKADKLSGRTGVKHGRKMR
eukprot:TRINITY_DN69522_c0_g1_i1.p1 TRINITY_DN69522_c0_g1~~TRINITY_DN69522_c0_g1_i1.p1  ORF type:complete len:327 (+),score=28.68 TRINITY_DN69522_c0_g1_i1:97-1077(+)